MAKPFPGSERYWIERYEFGGNSGDGSYRRLAEFKAEFLNRFVRQKGVESIIEYGCGDGNQLKLAEYPSYTGFDVSQKALLLCRKLCLNDTTKTFKLMSDYRHETAELALSLDVIYHLIEDEVFSAYMGRLFDSSRRYVIAYTSDPDSAPPCRAHHVKHRNICRWVDTMRPGWKLVRYLPNRHPFQGDTKTGSFSDFYVYERR